MFSRIFDFPTGLLGAIRGRWQKRRRGIFRYWDGERPRAADPLVVLQFFAKHPTFRLDHHPAFAAEGDVDAQRITVVAVREAFGATPYSFDGFGDHGLTDEETMELLSAFAEYLNALKKNGSQPATSPAAMASACS